MNVLVQKLSLKFTEAKGNLLQASIPGRIFSEL